MIRVPAVDVPTGEARREAEIFPAEDAKATAAASRVQPRNPDAVTWGEAAHPGAARRHSSDDLMSRHDRRPARREVALDDVEIGPADAAHLDVDEHHARVGERHRPLDEPQRPRPDRPRVLDDQRPSHPFSIAQRPSTCDVRRSAAIAPTIK